MAAPEPTQPRTPGSRGPLKGQGGAPRKEPSRVVTFRVSVSEREALKARMLPGETWEAAVRRWAGI